NLTKTIGNTAPGTALRLGVVHKGVERTLTVTLGELPVKKTASAPPPKRGDAPENLGLKLAPASSIPGAGADGVVIVGLDPAGIAADQGLELGDVILEIAGKLIKVPGEIQNALIDARRQGRSTILLRL